MTRTPVRYWSPSAFLPLLLAIGIAAVIAVFSVRDWTSYVKLNKEAMHHDDIAQRANKLLSDLKDAETGQRGYLLTGKAAYLEPYRVAASDIEADLAALAQTSGAADQNRLDRIRDLAENKMLELRKTIDLRSEGGLAAALPVVETDRGRMLMDGIRSQLTGLIQDEQQRQYESQRALERDAMTLRWTSVLGSVALVGLLLTAHVALVNSGEKRMRLMNQLGRSRDEAAGARDLSQTTLQSIGDAVIATDAEGRVTFLNPVAQHLTGWTQQSAVGVPLHRVFRILNEATRETVENPVEKVIRTGRIVGLANHTILVSLDGREIPIDDSAAPIRGANQDLLGTVLVFRDVTEIRRAEAELKKGRSELERSNTALLQLNADLELFSYAAGHDLQEPLRTISSFSELVVRRISGNADVAQHLRLIQDAANRMRTLIDGLLQFSQLMHAGTADMEQVRMDEVAGEALLNCAAAINESNAVVRTGPLPVIRANRHLMLQLLQNLIGNAIKYRSERVPQIDITSDVSNSGDWLFNVRDNGIGLDMVHAESIFQAFRRLHSSERYTGTGLGLAMCKRIVEIHGGRIWVESEPNCGSIFRFTISRTHKSV